MKMKNLLMLAMLGLIGQSIKSAILTIKNDCPYLLQVHPVLSRQDEYVAKFKYPKVPAGDSVSYNSGIYPILGVRWKKIMTNKDGKSQIILDYLTTDMPKISVTNLDALIRITSNGYQYFKEAKTNRYDIDSKGTLIAANLYERLTDGTVRQFTGNAREMVQKLQNQYGKGFRLKGDYLDDKSEGFSDWVIMKK